MFRELELVVLTRNVPEHRLLAGDVGTVLHWYKDGEAYEVEFLTGDGLPAAVVTLSKDDVREIDSAEVLHVRRIR
ncbi:MAG: DUF4926 domain-containing protein [SAR202 cluster bacterium]|nr:DUF4926 domain-containing protein [SAR202 cluster bacterium]